jgi:histidyl-tRNA synthetase
VSEGAGKKEEKPRKFQAIRGTRDLLPPETALWNRVEQTAHEVFGTFGFGEIRLPILEEYDLFSRSVGEESDIVAKELLISWDAPVDVWDVARARLSRALEINWHRFAAQTADAVVQNVESGLLIEAKKFRDSSVTAKEFEQYFRDLLRMCFEGSDEWRNLRNYLAHVSQINEWTKVTLRPEATASVCRAYIEHSMQQLPQPVKLYYMGPMFRRERPQKGRYRQFYQIGAEVLGGSDAPAIDAEVIEMVMTFFERLELPGVQLDLNSIGHAADNCRRGYVEKLKAELEKVKDKLGADSQRRIETNPLRVLDSKLEHEQPIIEKLPRIADHLCEECKAHYAAVKRQLDLRGVKYHENWRLVRGLDYYMRTTFEITAKGLGSQNAVCGGGRYDGLVELLGGPPTKGIGFAIGEDRLILSLQEGEKEVTSGEWRVASERRGVDIYVAWMGERALEAAVRAAKNLRQAGFRVELPPVELKFGKALGQADKLGAKYALILGDNEVASGEWTLKTLGSGEQVKLSEAELVENLRKARS